MLIFIIFAVIAILYITGCGVTGLITRLIASLRFRKKFIKAGMLIASIPLALISLILLLGGTDFAIVLVTIIVPFIVPALLSGAGVGYFIGGRVLGPTPIGYTEASQEYYHNRRESRSRRYRSNRKSDVFDTTWRYVEEDPYGSMKSMMWRANHPQPKDLPEIRK